MIRVIGLGLHCSAMAELPYQPYQPHPPYQPLPDLNDPGLCCNECLGGSHVDGRREVIPLRVLAANRLERRCLVHRLDAFRNGRASALEIP